MSIITISRRPFSRGTEVAESVARRLGYNCVAREVLFEASEKYGLHVSDFIGAIHDAPSFSDHFHYGRERYVAFFQAALLELLQHDNIVYHGLAGHFFIQGISHALKVRVITTMDERVSVLTSRENISKKNAMRVIKNEDKDRQRWSRHFFGIDTADSSLYNLVLNIHNLSVADATEIICHTLSLERFRTTPESQRKIKDMVRCSLLKAALVPIIPDVQVHSEGGKIVVISQGSKSEDTSLRREVEKIAKTIPGIDRIVIQTDYSTRHYD